MVALRDESKRIDDTAAEETIVTEEDSTGADDGDTEKEKLVIEIKKRRLRREEEERDAGRSFWRSVGVMGVVGWSVAVPTALGAWFGAWLDTKMDSGHVFFAFFMLTGLVFGCWVAWKAVLEHM